MNNSPILHEGYNRDLFGKHEKEFHTQGGMKGIEELMNQDTLRLIHKWRAEGKMRPDLGDDMILALLNATRLLILTAVLLCAGAIIACASNSKLTGKDTTDLNQISKKILSVE